MSDPDVGPAATWFALALGDLAVAQAAATGSGPSLRAAAEHAQQASEKALKAVLALDGQEPPRTHDLVALRWRLRDPSLVGLPVDLDALSDAHLAARYPAFDTPAFDASRVRRLVADAEMIIEAVGAALRRAGLDTDAVAPR